MTFRATDLLFERPNVLVKVYRKHLFDSGRQHCIAALSWFMGTRHRQLVPILDAGLTKEGDFYIVREFYPQLQEFKSVSLDDLRPLVATISFLQTNGIVHGSLKPSNFLFLEGNCHLADPRLHEASLSRESEDEIRYTAPEVLRGQKRTLESDLYSVGALFYRYFAGQHLFDDHQLSQLKLKYTWGDTQPLQGASPVQAFFKPTHQLLQKDPKRRTAGFHQLIEILRAEPTPADRSVCVGRNSILEDLRQFTFDQTNSALQAIVIDGEPGIGKSRLIEELRTRCALDPLQFSVCNSKSHTKSLAFVATALHDLVRRVRKSDEGKLHVSSSTFEEAISSVVRGDFNPDQHSIQRLTSSLVGLLAVLAQRVKIILVIEDIDSSDATIVPFIEQLCFRATEVPIKLLLTSRINFFQTPLGKTLSSVLGHDIRQIRLDPLTPIDGRRVLRLLQGQTLELDHALKLCDGNPLFIQEYAAGRGEKTSGAISEVVNWMLSRLTRDERRLAQALAILDTPIATNDLAPISGETIPVVTENLARLYQASLLKVLDDKFLLRSIVRSKVLDGIGRKRFGRLNRNAFEILRNGNHPLEEVARFAFNGGLAHEAGALFRQLATSAIKEQNFIKLIRYSAQLFKCSRRGGFALTLRDKAILARSYHETGKVQQERKLYQEILNSEGIHDDSELMSLARMRLAIALDRSQTEPRILLQRLAMESASEDSPEFLKRCLELFLGFLRLSDIESASKVLREAEKRDSTHRAVVFSRFLFLMNIADFTAATKCSRPENPPAAAINNLAICFEHLGQLGKAEKLFERAHQQATENGHFYVEILSRSNLGCIKTKLGELPAARTLHETAIEELERLRQRDQKFDGTILTTLYADSAAHFLCVNDYSRANEYLQRVSLKQNRVFPLDRALGEIVKCTFYSHLGQVRSAETSLKSLRANPISGTEFFETQQALLEARIFQRTSAHIRTRLEHALEATQKIDTLYLQCEVLNELARVCIELNDNSDAARHAKKALGLSRRNGYRLLGARALLLAGMCAENQTQKQRYLYSAFQDASEMGLRELIAESAFQIGIFQLSLKNFVTAQEYLMRSISVVEDIAEGVPERFRTAYLGLGPHRKALQALKVCNPEVQKLLSVRSSTPDFGSEKRYFSGLYQLTASTNSAASAEAVAASIANSLDTTLSRAALVTLKHNGGYIDKTIRVKSNEELLRRAHQCIGKTKDRIYLGSSPTVPRKPIAWIPLKSAAYEGGMYVLCGAQERSFTEKEIEFLTVAGTIGSSALNALDGRRQEETRRNISDVHNIIGASKAIKDLHSHIEAAAGNAATVLIEGESGTGKELVAKAIHASGARAKEPFVAVDCGALPESLIEAELFGARKGSYTGAVADRPGLFEAAHRGTLFLDEISNTTPALQAKLLRVIQEREVRRIGETKGRPVDVRLIAATNQDLKSLTEDGRFRSDLLYRLKVLHIRVPALRNRREDIPMLAEAFLQKLNSANQTKRHFGAEAIDQLSKYDYPGNVRELQNTVERAFFSARGTVIIDIPLAVTSQAPVQADEVVSWFKDLSEGRQDFWSAVHSKYKRRDISREKVLALVDFGLRSTQGNYKALASTFHLKPREYRRFMDFLRRNECLLDFRPYRRSAADREN